ncbi:MAG: helix-turn-helix domain-containing protein [Spirochaetota bacterium]|jgi:transcriptional regulator with XRE-family HTH domain|nr:helix-turn-helix domain-containing protein [Spirochaetota bacterium]
MSSGQDLRLILGERIRFYRKQRQLSQASLAGKADISITFLSNIERGIKYPTSDTLSSIAAGLGVEAYQLFRQDSGDEYQNLLDRFKKDITENVLKTLETVYKAYEK